MRKVWKDIWRLARVGVCVSGWHGQYVAIHAAYDAQHNAMLCTKEEAYSLLMYAIRLKATLS